MQLDQVISNPDLEGDYSPIYTTEKKGSVPVKKLVRTRYFFLVNLPYYVFQNGSGLAFSGFGAMGGYGPRTEKKKRVRIPFAVRKRCANASSFRTIFSM